MTDINERLSFSQRNGLAAIPTQLVLGELDGRARALIHRPIIESIAATVSHQTYSGTAILGQGWQAILRDLHVDMNGQMVHTFDPGAEKWVEALTGLHETGEPNEIFDFLEFLLSRREVGGDIRVKLTNALVQGRTAYRVLDGKTVSAVGTVEAANGIETAVELSRECSPGAMQHIASAGAELRRGNWAASVRESIHAVESVTVRLAPSKGTLSEAIGLLEKQGKIHPALKAAFTKLYAYTSDSEGVRHALVFDDAPNVDEADALFMLTACAGFVSYLIMKSGTDLTA